MADSKLAHTDPIQNPSPTPKRPKSQDAPRSRSGRKPAAGSSEAPPEGQPRELFPDQEGGNRYSPRGIHPEAPFPPKQVATLVATYEGKQIEGEAAKRFHDEAAADGFAAIEKADAAGYEAALQKVGALGPTLVTNFNPFATAEAAPTALDEAATPIPNAELIPVGTTPSKRKKSTGGDDKDDDDEMEEDGGDPNTLAQEVQLRKPPESLVNFSELHFWG